MTPHLKLWPVSVLALKTGGAMLQGPKPLWSSRLSVPIGIPISGNKKYALNSSLIGFHRATANVDYFIISLSTMTSKNNKPKTNSIR